jgi:hypothetical protein
MELIRQGYKSVEDLRNHLKRLSTEDLNMQNLLTRQQLIGLKYFEEFDMRIPRAEVEEIEQLVRGYVLR